MCCGTARHLSRVAGAVLLAAAAWGCASGPPDEAYRLPPTTLEVRELQTRSYEADEAEILGASLALLQDMEYNINEVETYLGVLSAAKVVDADSVAQQAGLLALDFVNLILAALGGGTGGSSAYASADDRIGLQLTLVVLPSLAREGEYTARVTVQSTLYDKADRVKERGVVVEPVIYQEIFDKLSRALFLERETP